MFSWHALGKLIHIQHCPNKALNLNIFADPARVVMMMFHPNDDGYFKQNNAFCFNTIIEEDWFEDHEREFTSL